MSRATRCRARRIPAAALAAVLLAAPAAALELNGFLPARGSGDLAISYTAEGYERFWVGDVEVSDPGVGDVEIDSISLWLQWGLTDDLAVVLDAAHVDATSDGLGHFEDSGPQDLTALLEYRLFAGGGHSLVGAAGVRTPISDYEANLPVDLGDGTTDTLLRLVYQFNGGSFYFSQQVGYDLRGEDAPDGMPLHTELGYTAGRATFTGFYSVLTTDGGTDIGDPGFTFPSNADEYTRAGLKVFLRATERLGVSLLGFDTLDGRNTGKTSGYSAGAVFRF